MVKKLLSSKILRLGFSAVLIYLAFRKIDVFQLFNQLRTVPVWFVGLMIVYQSITMVLGGIRWSYLLIDKPVVKDFWNFTKASFMGSFYSLFFPTAMAGDLLKWLPLMKKYNKLTKTRLASSVLIDRIIGFSAFTLVGLMALIVGKILNYQFFDSLLWLFTGLVAGILIFYTVVFTVNFDKFFIRFGNRYRIVDKMFEVVELLKSEHKSRIIKVFLISMISEPVWIMPVWFYSLIFGAGASLLDVYIFIPVIALILVLPISVAGFGARENLYLYFFGSIGLGAEKILLMSTFGGLLGVLNSLIGGIFLLF